MHPTSKIEPYLRRILICSAAIYELYRDCVGQLVKPTIDIKYDALVAVFLEFLSLATEERPLLLALDSVVNTTLRIHSLHTVVNSRNETACMLNICARLCALQDQLTDENRGRALGWLPLTKTQGLPPNVTIIISTLPEEGGCLDACRAFVGERSSTAVFIDVPALDGAEEVSAGWSWVVVVVVVVVVVCVCLVGVREGLGCWCVIIVIIIKTSSPQTIVEEWLIKDGRALTSAQKAHLLHGFRQANTTNRTPLLLLMQVSIPSVR